jgi:hypothetical protein
MNLTETQSAVIALIKRFVERHQLVRAAIGDLRPHFLLDRGSTVEAVLEWAQMDAKCSHEILQGGYWGTDNEWEYFVHGGGCRLTHTVTRELIDWDAPNIHRFDKFWLVDYLQWLLQQQSNDNWLQILKTQFTEQSTSLPRGIHSELREFIFPILEELSQAGVLAEPEGNKYTLLDVSRLETDQP